MNPINKPTEEQGAKQGSTEKAKPVTPMVPGDPSTWPEEFGGQSGPEPTRYGDWEKNGRCTDF